MAARYLSLASELRIRCVQMRRDGLSKLPGELALCEETGYSRQTVRHALKVLEQEGLVVRIHGSGTYLSEDISLKSGRIAVLVPSSETYLYPQLLRDIESVCNEAGYQMQVCVTDGLVAREHDVLAELLADPPDGLLVEGAKTALPSPNLNLFEEFGRRGIPFVWLHAPLPVPVSAPCFREDGEGGSRLLVRYLLDKGHTRIAGIFKSDDRQGQERYLGFVSELLHSGLPLHEENILWFDTEDAASLMADTDTWLERFVCTSLSPCTAVVCHNDEIAWALIRCLRRLRLRVPNDVAVVSFDNSHLCMLCSVPITSLGHGQRRLGTEAAEGLIRMLRGKKSSGARLEWTLYERRSG